MSTTTLTSSKKCDCVSLCRKHKSELKELLDEALLSSCTPKLSNIGAHETRDFDPYDKALQQFLLKRRASLSCTGGIRVYLHLLTDAHGEGISESFLTSGNWNCYQYIHKK